MATKKKPRKRGTRSKRIASKKATPKKTVKRPKKLAKKKSAPKRVQKKKASARRQVRKRKERLGAPEFSLKSPGTLSGEESGDLQGLSNVESADSESVDELLEEGNAFEADVVSGVESADDADEQEVHTHEVPEDDVPSEYLDEE